MRAAIQNEEQELMSLSYLAGTESLSSQMPISSQRALRACEAVIVDDIKCAEFLSRLPDHVLDSPFLSEDRTDEYIVAFLRGKVAGEVWIWPPYMALFPTLSAYCP